jgi:hypothetical protein
VEALDMGGLGGPKQTIYNMLGQAVTLIKSVNSIFGFASVARERRHGDRPPKINVNNGGWGDIYLVNVGRQGIRCLLAVKNGVGVAT